MQSPIKSEIMGFTSSSFGWMATIMTIVAGLVALYFDFVAFKASESSRARRGTTPQQDVGNGKTSSKGDAVGANGAESVEGCGHSKGAVLQVQPLPAPANYLQARKVWILGACVLGAYACHRLDAAIQSRICAIAGCLVALLPHLLRCSKYREDPTLGCKLDDEDRRRSVTDMLVWTSFVYIAPSIYGVFVHQYGIATLQLLTTIGSTLFHLTRETKFFNLDNIFASSLLLTVLWGLVLAVRYGIWWYVATIGLGGPLAILCIVRCGMPGLVCRHPSGHGLCRRSNPEYDFFHMLWHLASGLITLVSIHFFEVYFPDLEAGGGYFDSLPDVPVVPAVSLCISFFINFYGNHAGLMPLD